MELTQAESLLARTPLVVEALLADLPPELVHRDDGPGTWSAYAVVGHLLHGDLTNWLPRARSIVEHGVGQPFAPFDRVAMLGWEHEPIAELLARFQATRSASLDALAAMDLGAADLDRRGLHPEFGEVTLVQLLATWVAHDLTHIGQVSEVLARHYRDEVGPWRVLLPALERVVAAE
jgi:uncharacterized damage-inducible protein DinB